MSYNASYKRPVSPGSRNIQNPGRISDSRVSDASMEQYRSDRNGSYTSPKSSTGVIPISSETFYNFPPQTSRSDQQRYDSYTGRPADLNTGSRSRHASISETQRNPGSSTAIPTRSRPTVVQNDVARPSSPLKGSQGKDYYVTPNASKEPRKETHKKVYSVTDGSASLVADVNVPRHSERHHRRRESDSGERGGYMRPPTERDSARRSYHANGPPSKRTEKSIEDDDAYSYTDARGMFRDTEPSWRDGELPRRRRNSIDRGSGERPTSMLDPAIDPRRQSRDMGPPPSTRGWDKVNDISRSRSVTHRPREGSIPQSPTRARNPISPTDSRVPQSPTRGSYGDPRDPYYVPPRTTGAERYSSTQPDRDYQYEYREPRRTERRNSTTRASDRSVSRRGFGIRSDSQDRYGRGSDETFDQQNQYRDSGHAFAGPLRRETAPDMSQQYVQKLEQDKRDRELERDTRERDAGRRDDEARDYTRDYDRDRAPRRERDSEHDVDRERERERERLAQPQSEPERHHYRSGSYRDRDYDQKDNSPRHSGETIAQPGLSTAAGGLAAAAASYGLGSYYNRNNEHDLEREPDRRRDRSHEHDRDHERDFARPEPHPVQDTRPKETRSDESVPYQQERERNRTDEHDRGLGFAYENPPEPSKSAPPVRDRSDTATSREIASDRDFERTHEDYPTGDKPQLTLDPDEDYRRRKEQAQRELGRVPDEQGSEYDPDRERRQRERQQRQLERENRNGDPSAVGTNSTYTDDDSAYQMPGSYNDSFEGTESTTSRGTLRRRPSILDEPMNSEPAQIIDNSMSERKENRVRIVDPPTEEEEKRPKGILKKPKERFPEHPNEVREGVAPLKDAKGSGIPPGARWTKIDRRLVNPEALEEAKERFEERLDCVIVLRVLTKEDIQKLADRTKALRDERYYDEREEKKAARRRDRHRDRRERDEYDDDSENEFKPRAPRMLEAPAPAGASSTGDQTDYFQESKDRRRDWDGGDRDSHYMSGGNGRRDEY